MHVREGRWMATGARTESSDGAAVQRLFSRGVELSTTTSARGPVGTVPRVRFVHSLVRWVEKQLNQQPPQPPEGAQCRAASLLQNPKLLAHGSAATALALPPTGQHTQQLHAGTGYYFLCLMLPWSEATAVSFWSPRTRATSHASNFCFVCLCASCWYWMVFLVKEILCWRTVAHCFNFCIK